MNSGADHTSFFQAQLSLMGSLCAGIFSHILVYWVKVQTLAFILSNFCFIRPEDFANHSLRIHSLVLFSKLPAGSYVSFSEKQLLSGHYTIQVCVFVWLNGHFTYIEDGGSRFLPHEKDGEHLMLHKCSCVTTQICDCWRFSWFSLW